MNLALLMALRRAARDHELRERLGAVIFLALWAELAAAGGRNPGRAPWMRTTAPRGSTNTLARARRSVSGRRARG